MNKLLAQNTLCLRDMQAFHESLDREKGFDLDMLRNVAYLSEEIGEVVHAICVFKKAEGSAALESAREHLGEELADCLAYILKLANYGGVDLQEAYVRKLAGEMTIDEILADHSHLTPDDVYAAAAFAADYSLT